MKIINVKNTLYTATDTQVQVNGFWIGARPLLLSPNLKERFVHSVLGRHFTFGQPYCVVCGLAEAPAHPKKAGKGK